MPTHLRMSLRLGPTACRGCTEPLAFLPRPSSQAQLQSRQGTFSPLQSGGAAVVLERWLPSSPPSSWCDFSSDGMQKPRVKAQVRPSVKVGGGRGCSCRHC